MAELKAATVAAYIKQVPVEKRATLSKLRTAIRKAAKT